MSGDLPFLDDHKAEEQVAAPEVTPEPQPEAKGEPAPQEQAAPPAAQEDHGKIPIAALLDEREKRKEREREAEELRRKVAEYEARARQQAEPRPDFFADPEAALTAAARAAQAAALNTKLEMSRFQAEKDYSRDEVQAAYEFFDRNPHLSGALLNHPSPFHKAVEEYRIHSQVEKLRTDPNAYEAEIEARLREKILAELATQPKPTAPPPSITASPSTSQKAPVVSGFAQMFGD